MLSGMIKGKEKGGVWRRRQNRGMLTITRSGRGVGRGSKGERKKNASGWSMRKGIYDSVSAILRK